MLVPAQMLATYAHGRQTRGAITESDRWTITPLGWNDCVKLAVAETSNAVHVFQTIIAFVPGTPRTGHFRSNICRMKRNGYQPNVSVTTAASGAILTAVLKMARACNV